MAKTIILSTSHADNISKPFFKIDSIPNENEESFIKASSNSHFLKIISYQIKQLDASLKGKFVSCLDQTCQDQVSDTSSSEEDEDDNTNFGDEEALNVIEEAFKEPAPLAINKIRNWTHSSTRNYYPMPTPLIFKMKKEEVLLPLTSMENQCTLSLIHI